MHIVHSRRLTGLNLDTDGPSAITEVIFEAEEESERILDLWQDTLQKILSVVGWMPTKIVARRFKSEGKSAAALVFEAPIDGLYAALEINEWSINRAKQLYFDAEQTREIDRTVLDQFQRMIAAERNEPLRSLLGEAHKRQIPTLVDDDFLSMGYGIHGKTWPKGRLPKVTEVPWSQLKSIPIAAITGTNGKTTSTRLLAHIVKQAGMVVGHTSTDGIVVGERVIEKGDWTGSEAARKLLRHPDVEFAVLEAARGGLLRRGFSIRHCHAALITNVSSDHLEEYGIMDLATMARVKATIARAVMPSGRIVLNADSPPLCRLEQNFAAPVVWFSLHADLPLIHQHRERGGEAWFLAKDEKITYARGSHCESVISIHEIPCTFAGAARHNIANALGVCALATALDLPRAAILAGLKSFHSSLQDNPGRCNLLEVNGIKVLLDFAHNPDGILQIRNVVSALRNANENTRLFVSIGIAGDRNEGQLQAIAQAIAGFSADRIVIREQLKFLRGRKPGEVPQILLHALQKINAKNVSSTWASTEVEVLTDAFTWAKPDDLIVILAHTERSEVQTFLQQFHRVVL